MVANHAADHPADMTTNPYCLIYDIVNKMPVFQVMRGRRLIYESDTLDDARRVADELGKAIR